MAQLHATPGGTNSCLGGDTLRPSALPLRTFAARPESIT
jgi:hypothetical protein